MCRRRASRRPVNARPSVSSSAYSRSPPTGQPAGEARDAHAFGQQVGDVHGGRLTGHGGVGRQDDLVDRGLLHAVDELGDVQVGGLHAVERAEGAAQHVVEAVELARALDGDDVGRLLDDADEARLAARVGADGAQLAFGEVEALPAEPDLLLDLGDGRRQRQDLLPAGA